MGCTPGEAPRDGGSDAGSPVDVFEGDVPLAAPGAEARLRVRIDERSGAACADWEARRHPPALEPEDPRARWERSVSSGSIRLADDGSLRLVGISNVRALGHDGVPRWSTDLAGRVVEASLAPDGSTFALVSSGEVDVVLLQQIDALGVIVAEQPFTTVPTAAWGAGTVVVGPHGRVWVTTDRVHELCRTTPLSELSILDEDGTAHDAIGVAIDAEGAIVVSVYGVSRALRVDPLDHGVSWLGTGVPTSLTVGAGPFAIAGTRVLVGHIERDDSVWESPVTLSLSLALPGGRAVDLPADVTLLDARGRTIRSRGTAVGTFWDRDDGTSLTLPCEELLFATERGLSCSARRDGRIVLRDIAEDGSIATELDTGVPSERGLGDVRLDVDGRLLWTFSPDGVTGMLVARPSELRPARGWWAVTSPTHRAWGVGAR